MQILIDFDTIRGYASDWIFGIANNLVSGALRVLDDAEAWTDDMNKRLEGFSK